MSNLQLQNLSNSQTVNSLCLEETRLIMGGTSALKWDDHVMTGGGNDDIDTTDGDDYISSGDGDDTIRSRSGRNRINAGPGDDIITLY